MAAYIRRIEQCQLLSDDANEPWTDAQLVRIGQTAIGKTGVFKREYKDCLQKPLADRKWTDFRKYWMEEFKSYEAMNKLTATESGFGADAMAEEAS